MQRAAPAAAPALVLAVMTLPVLAGLAGVVMLARHSDGFSALFSWPGLGPALWLSVKTGLVSTLIALSLCFLILASLVNTRALSRLQHLLSPLIAVPHAAAALGLAFLIAPSGWIFRALSPWATGWNQPPDWLIVNDAGGWALIFGLVVKELPFLLLMALATLPQADVPRRIAQAQSLGAGRAVSFLVGCAPHVYRGLRLPVFAVLAYGMTSVDMAMILGPTRPPTLAVQVAEWMTDPALREQGAAAAAALVLLGAVLALLGLWIMAERVAAPAMTHWATTGPRGAGLDPALRLAGLGLGGGLSLMAFAGLFALALWSFAGLWTFPQAWPQGLNTTTWARAAPALTQSLACTLLIAVVSTAAALALTIAFLESEGQSGRGPRADVTLILYLPLLVPQIAFLPGLQVAALWAGVDGHWVAVAAIHLVFVLPYVFLSLSPAYRAWDRRISIAAMALGATPARIFWRLRLPLLLRPVLTAAAIGMAVSVGQYLPTLLIGGGRVETLTTEAVALSSGGNRRVIGAYALLQMLVPALCFALATLIPAWAYRHRKGMEPNP